MTDPLLTQQEAADLLRVSVRYLRASTCPKVLLPSTRPGARKLVRYDRNAIEGWLAGRRVTLRKVG